MCAAYYCILLECFYTSYDHSHSLKISGKKKLLTKGIKMIGQKYTISNLILSNNLCFTIGRK